MMWFSNGMQYSGRFLSDKMHGPGSKLTLKTGEYIVGEWVIDRVVDGRLYDQEGHVICENVDKI